MVRLEERIGGQWTDRESMLWWKGRWISGPQFLKRVAEVAAELKKNGFGEGDRLVTLLPVCPAYQVLSVAVWTLGGAIVPLNAGASPEAMIPAMTACGAALCAVRGDRPETVKVYRDAGVNLVPLTLEGEFMDSFRVVPSFKTPRELALIFFTSGTTGTPKGVPLTHANLNAVIDASKNHALPDHDTSQIMFNVLPNFHALGCVVSGYLPMAVGYREALQPSFLPVSETLGALEASGSTITVVVPTMLHFLAGAALKAGLKLPDLKLVICGGDRLNGALEDRMNSAFNLRLVEGYGLTEAAPVLAVTAHDRAHKRGTVGQLLPGVEYRLTDREGTEPIDGNEGLLWVRGPSIIQAYFGSAAESKDRFCDGWLNTGDLVRIDDEGTVTILERVSDLIIVGGFNVYPQEVEAVLLAHPAVSGAGVVGCRQSVSGEVIRGYVTLHEGATVGDNELVDWCRSRLPHFKTPRRVEVLPELPVNALGKVMRRKLRERCAKD